jgi:hypothetical protein
VVAEFHAALESVLEDLGEPTPLRERDHAPADVPGRCDPELLAKPAARPAVVSDRDHAADAVAARLPQSAQQEGSPVPPPNATTRGAFATVSSLPARVWPMSSGLPVFGRPLDRRISSTSRNCHEAKSVGERADA